MSTKHHPIFSKFPKYEGSYNTYSISMDFLGHKIYRDFHISPYFPEKKGDGSDYEIPYTFSFPEIEEEYFEWIAILESVFHAKDQFVCLELGSGFGRWSARAGIAARLLGLPFHLYLVEGEPAHVAWTHKHMKLNEIGDDQYDVLNCTVGRAKGKTPFYISRPSSEKLDKNFKSDHQFDQKEDDWYGQSVAFETDHPIRFSNWKLKLGKYYGHRVHKNESGYYSINVKQRTLSSILSKIKHPIIDICDMDIQGMESDVIYEAIDLINKRIKKLFIATHNKDVEESIRKLLRREGWKQERDYSCFQEADTEFGKISFQDGVQIWNNPRLSQPPHS